MRPKRPRHKRQRSTPAWLKALGRHELPETIRHDAILYTRVRIFKHDFFAATGLYQGPNRRVVYKVGRVSDLFGFPMAWLGERLCRREAEAYARVCDLEGVPAFVGRCGQTGFIHEYAAGSELVAGDRVGERFFPELEQLVRQVHAREMAYVDLEKNENILVGRDGRPKLIDFQISWYWPPEWGGRTRLARWILRQFQDSDNYHLLKHWRRFRPDQLTQEQIDRSRNAPLHIRLHRLVARPLTRFRRSALKKLDPNRVRAA